MDDGIVALIGVVLAVAAYAGFCYAVIVYALVPAFPFLTLGGLALGVLCVIGVAVATLLGLEMFAPPTVTPDAAVLRLPKSKTKFDRDRAWAGYLFAQWQDDLFTASGHLINVVQWVWKPAKMVGENPGVLLAGPLLLLPLALELTFTLGAAVAGLAACATCGVVLGLAWLGWLAVMAAMRGADLALQRLRGAKATCTECSFRNRLPAYRCPCGEMHHDIRSGRQGLLARRCNCERLLPTTVLRMGASLAPHCQNCGLPLRGDAGAITDISLPVFGPTSAGKTRLVYAAMVGLDRHVRSVGGDFETLGMNSETKFALARSVVESRTETTKTQANEPRVAVTLHLSHGQRQAHLHLSDAAGELFTSREQNSDLRFLDDTEGLIFVLDPFSIPAVRDELKGPFAVRRAAASPADLDPEQSYLVTTQRLGDQGVKLNKMALAVAVVKTDLLWGLPCAGVLSPDSDSDTVMDWLIGLGLDNLVEGVGRDFDTVRYFLVSSFDDQVDSDGMAATTSAAQPLLWLLSRSKFPLPVTAEVAP